ncbi:MULTISPECIES: alpha/beta hydrolase [Nonomuraea]|uniref:Alpha/beta hydrolase fold domain-containing protein n=1 Tax=Nonomuraea ferruginea TaxID=46174 RepID=A0ABT4T954_9ACTN|nr:alpha/beta hydrolase fold domain-containing protein [Nonomuraea ferruginea]MDA0645870.1 alpha/beta hydrolase fold domain-containing protein [Nonomuraea ferruginea]
MSDVLVLIGPGLAADEALLGEIAEREFVSLGVRGVITRVRDPDDVRARTRRRHPGWGGGQGERHNSAGHAVVILPGPGELRTLMAEPLGPVTWLDIWRADGVEVAEDATHLHGRGLAGLRWAVRHAVHRIRHPHVRIPYGPHRDQWGHLYLPSAGDAGPARAVPEGGAPSGAAPKDGPASAAAEHGALSGVGAGSTRAVPEGDVPSGDPSPAGDVGSAIPVAEGDAASGEHGVPLLPRRRAAAPGVRAGEVAGGPSPVVVLVHGGYWRSVWAADLMEALCADLTARGFAVWNLEYRRPDLHGWDATTADVAAGMEALTRLDAPLDLGRLAVAGHSAGGQLALRAAADGAGVALAVSLAGVLDLVEGDRRWVGTGAVAAALGVTTWDDLPERERSTAERVYGGASPLVRVPIKVRQLIVQGSGDDLDLVDFGRRYARAAANAGDEVTYLEMVGDHFAVIDPRTPIWEATAHAIAEALH